MELWQPGFDSDFALLAWHLHLGETGDLERIFSRGVHRLGAFIRQFDPPCELLFAKDEHGWFACMWTWPLMDGATVSLWVREDRRQSKESYQFIKDALNRFCERYPVLLFVTRDEATMRQGMHFGFELLGSIPYFFDGDAAFVGTATPFTIESALQPSHKDIH